jgi:hypothetical protein
MVREKLLPLGSEAALPLKEIHHYFASYALLALDFWEKRQKRRRKHSYKLST